jgi:hypothetical protein
MKIRRKIDYQRVENTQPEVLKPWYEQFQALIHLYKVNNANIWNMDKLRLDLGHYMNQQVVGGSKSKRSYVKSPKTREWVTIIEVISALSRFLHLTVIFKRKSVQISWFHHDYTQD